MPVLSFRLYPDPESDSKPESSKPLPEIPSRILPGKPLQYLQFAYVTRGLLLNPESRKKLSAGLMRPEALNFQDEA